MLKALNKGVLYLTCVCQVAWCSGRALEDTWVIIPTHQIGDRNECNNYRGIYLPRLSGKVYDKCLDKRCREIMNQSWMKGI